MSREPFEAMPDVMDAKQLAEALQISKAGAYNLLSSPGFPTLRIGGRKLVKSRKNAKSADRTRRNVLPHRLGHFHQKMWYFSNSRAGKNP